MANPYSDALAADVDDLTAAQIREIADALLEEAHDDVTGNTRYWFERVADDGVSPELINELNRSLGKRKVVSCSYIDPRTKRLRYRELKEVATSTESAGAVLIAALIVRGEMDRLKRCLFDECQRFFFGNAKAKYCSDRCGSNVRVRAIRNKQRKRSAMI